MACQVFDSTSDLLIYPQCMPVCVCLCIDELKKKGSKKNSKKILNIYSVMMIVMFFPYSRERERRRDPTPTQRYITSDPSLRDSCVILLLSFSRKKKKLLSFLSFFMKTCNLFRRCC